MLNGAGECTGFLAAAEWGLAETPVFLTSTMQLGRVYDAACELLIAEETAIGDADVIIPVVAECDDSFLADARRMQVQRDDVREALAAARASAGATVAAPRGRGRLGHRDELPGLQGRHRHLVPGGARRGTVGVVVMTNFGDRERLTVAGVPGRAAAAGGRPDAAAGRPGRAARPGRPAGSCIVVVLTDGPLDSAACTRLARRAGLGLARTGSTAHHGSGEIFLAVATGLRAARGAAPARSPVTGSALDDYFAAVVEATESAVLNSLLQAQTVTGRDGHTSYGLPAGPLRALATGPAERPGGRTAMTGARRSRRGGPPPAAARRRPVRLDARPGPAGDAGVLAAKHAWYDGQTAPQQELREELFAEWPAQFPPAEESARWRQGGSWYPPGPCPASSWSHSTGPRARRPGRGAAGREPAAGATRPPPAATPSSVSARSAPTGDTWPTRWTSTATRCTSYGSTTWPPARSRGADRATYYGLAWPADSRALLYVVTDRVPADEVWRHELGTRRTATRWCTGRTTSGSS